MSNDLIKTADDARRLLRGFKAIDELVDAFEDVGKLEQRKDEAEKALASLQPELVAARQSLSTAQAEVKSEQSKAKAVIADAKEQADEIVKAAGVKALEIEAKAQGVLADAKNQAAAVALAAQGEAAQAQTLRDELLAECTALEARIGKAQAQIAKLLG